MSLDTVILPNGITTIKSKAFADSSISRIYLPSSLKTIASDAFAGCNVIGYGPENTVASDYFDNNAGLTFDHKSEDSAVSDFTFSSNNDGTCTVTGFSGSYYDVVIPSYSAGGLVVTKIGASAFKGKTITSVYIPDTVTLIDSNAFYQCKSLTHVRLPASLQTVNKLAFYQCIALTSIDIPGSLTTIGANMFEGCKALANVTLRNGIEKIGSNAFESCVALSGINLPSSLKTINDHAFLNCTGLASITIPDGVLTIGSYAFSGCTGLATVNLADSITNIGTYAFNKCKALSTVKWPAQTLIVASHTFDTCTGLTSIYLHNNVNKIDTYAFDGCSSLITVKIPASMEAIGSYAFCNSGIVTMNIPSTVSNIGSYAFASCKKLKNITIPESVTNIGTYAFQSCSTLPVIELPNSIGTIQASTFRNCDALKEVIIPNSVLSIQNYAFYGCDGLTTITIPSSVTSLGTYVFNSCDKLVSAYIPESVLSIGNSCFSNSANLTIYGVAGSAANTTADSLSKVSFVPYEFGATESNATFTVKHSSQTLYAISSGSSSFSITLGDATSENDVYTMTVSSNSEWSVSNECDWLDCERSGNTVTLKGNSNISYKKLTGEIVFTVDGKYITGRITKPEYAAGMYLKAYHKKDGNIDADIYFCHDRTEEYNNRIMFGSHTSSLNQYTLSFISNFDWMVTSSGNWFTVSPQTGTGSNEEQQIIIKFNNNLTSDRHTGTITFNLGDNDQSVTLNVEKPRPESELAMSVSLNGTIYNNFTTYRDTGITVTPGQQLWPSITWGGDFTKLEVAMFDGGGHEIPMIDQYGDSRTYVVDSTNGATNPYTPCFVFPEGTENGTYWLTAIIENSTVHHEIQIAVKCSSGTTAADLPNSLFMTQENDECTMFSVMMMVRSVAYINGSNTWSYVNKSNLKSSFWTTGGQYISHTVNWNGNTVSYNAKSTGGSISASSLKSLLNSHPEGIVIFAWKENGISPHAVFVTHYDGDTFYCADPASGYSGKYITLANSLLGKRWGNQAGILATIDQYWYIESYSIVN